MIPWEFVTRLRARALGIPKSRNQPGARLLLVVEGVHDIEFLRRISRMVHAREPRLPDLAAMESADNLIVVPFGGGDVVAWAQRFAALALPQIYLFDRE